MKSSPRLFKVENAKNTHSESDEPIVLFEHVSLRYGRRQETLSDVNFSLKPGSFTFLTGPSGAGKSTLLKLLYLALRPSRGFVHLFGQDVSALTAKDIQILKRRMGIVLQDFQLIDHLNIFENAALPLRVAGMRPEHYSSDVKELLQWVGLGKQLNALPATLSGGEKQRLSIARAVIAKPEILIADEPTGNVDPDISERLLRLFKEMNRMGTTVLLATHDLELLRKSDADRVRIEAGTLIKETST